MAQVAYRSGLKPVLEEDRSSGADNAGGAIRAKARPKAKAVKKSGKKALAKKAGGKR